MWWQNVGRDDELPAVELWAQQVGADAAGAASVSVSFPAGVTHTHTQPHKYKDKNIHVKGMDDKNCMSN